MPQHNLTQSIEHVNTIFNQLNQICLIIIHTSSPQGELRNNTNRNFTLFNMFKAATLQIHVIFHKTIFDILIISSSGGSRRSICE